MCALAGSILSEVFLEGSGNVCVFDGGEMFGESDLERSGRLSDILFATFFALYQVDHVGSATCYVGVCCRYVW